MLDTNTYLAYKRDEQYILYWLINAWNTIVKRNPDPDPNLQPNTTGRTTVSGILTMCKLVAAQPSSSSSPSVPAIIYKLFRSALSGRRAAMQQYQELQDKFPDPCRQIDNDTHRFFFDTMEEAFTILGGQAWQDDNDSCRSSDMQAESEDDIRLQLIANRFSVLSLESHADESSGEDLAPTIDKPQKRAPRKGVKGGKKKRGKRRPTSFETDQLPLKWEHYRIIGDDAGEKFLEWDHNLAAIGIAYQMSELRFFLQELWQQVAFEGLNGAVAAAVSKVAVAMVKRTEAAISINLPGNESFEAMAQAIAIGISESILTGYTSGSVNCGCFSGTDACREYRNTAKHGEDADGQNTVRGIPLPHWEVYLVATYRDLADFLHDFQKNRTGKPTKAMAASLGTWDPELDLVKATPQDRLMWRRTYTINLLYDLVNVISFNALQRVQNDENLELDKLDWSDTRWDEQQIFGLQEFGAAITTLAFQRPRGKNADVCHKVMPHMVFELACMVDSMCVSRGWSLDSSSGNKVRAPAEGFVAVRDINAFLHPDEPDSEHGLLGSMTRLAHLLRDSAPYEALARPDDRLNPHSTADAIDLVRHKLDACLGKLNFTTGRASPVPSRFSSTNPNGLHEYSPYLCGAGLAEAYEISSRLGLATWDRMKEPILLIHVHRMLVQKKYLEPVDFLSSLESVYCRGFFGAEQIDNVPELQQDGERKEARHHLALKNRYATAKTRPAPRRGPSRCKAQDDLMDMLNIEANIFFHKETSLLTLLHDAKWDPEHIADYPVPSNLVFARLRMQNSPGDTVEKVDFRRRLNARVPYIEQEKIDRMMTKLDGTAAPHNRQQAWEEKLKGDGHRPGCQCHKLAHLPVGRHGSTKTSELLSEVQVLEALKKDLSADISGSGLAPPFSCVKYFYLGVWFITIWDGIAFSLQHQNNALLVRAFDMRHPICGMSGGEPIIRLAMLMLKEGDEQTLRTMADVLGKCRASFANFLNSSYMIGCRTCEKIARSLGVSPPDEESSETKVMETESLGTETLEAKSSEANSSGSESLY